MFHRETHVLGSHFKKMVKNYYFLFLFSFFLWFRRCGARNDWSENQHFRTTSLSFDATFTSANITINLKLFSRQIASWCDNFTWIFTENNTKQANELQNQLWLTAMLGAWKNLHSVCRGKYIIQNLTRYSVKAGCHETPHRPHWPHQPPK